MKPKNKEELLTWSSQSKRLWLFLDYDGTLADFAPTPDQIIPDPMVFDPLDRLANLPGMRVAVISGRRLKDVRTLLPVTGIYLAGTYGLELSLPTGETINRIEYETIRPWLETIKPEWEQIIRNRSGFFLEDKGWSLALHSHYADSLEAEAVVTRAREVMNARSLPSSFRILGGHRFLEVVPKQANKGETVNYLLNNYPFQQAGLIYIGDDDKDEEAFAIIQARQGIAVKVKQPTQASSPTTADLFFDSPKDTIQWLGALLQQKK